MFRFAKDGCVRWPVTLQQVQEDGSTAEQSFLLTIERLTRAEKAQRDAEVLAYMQQYNKLMADEDLPEFAAQRAELAAQRAEITARRVAIDDALLRSRIKGWANVADQDGKPLPYSTATLDAFLNDELLRNVLLQGLLNASAGVASKNSLPGLAGLPVPAQA